jgi:carbon starvation protein
MFGIANQLLAATALAVGTTVLMREAPKPTYALLTLAPLLFVGTTTITAGIMAIQTNYLPLAKIDPRTGYVNTALTALLLGGVISILIGSAMRWVSLWRARRPGAEPAAA